LVLTVPRPFVICVKCGSQAARKRSDAQPGDPLTLSLVAALLIGVALAASYVPARRAARVDPTVALWYD
jgi:hypothetical protein